MSRATPSAGSAALLEAAVRRRVLARFGAAVFVPAAAAAAPFVFSPAWAAALFTLVAALIAWAISTYPPALRLVYGADGRLAAALAWYREEVLTELDLMIDDGRLDDAEATLGPRPDAQAPPWQCFEHERLARRLARARSAQGASSEGCSRAGLSDDEQRAARIALAVDDSAVLMVIGGPWRRRLAAADPPMVRSYTRAPRFLWIGIGAAVALLVANAVASSWPPPAPFSLPRATAGPVPSLGSGGWEIIPGHVPEGRAMAHDPFLSAVDQAVTSLTAALPMGSPGGEAPVATLRSLRGSASAPLLIWRAPALSGRLPGVGGKAADYLYFPFGDFARTGEPLIYVLSGDEATGTLWVVRISQPAAQSALDVLYPRVGSQ